MLALLVILTLLVVLAVGSRPLYGLYALILLLPFERIGSFDVSIANTVMTIRLSQIVGLALIVVALRQMPHKKILSRIESMPLIYLAAGLLSLLGAVSLKRGILVLLYSIFVWALFIAVARLTEKAEWERLEDLLWWATLAIILFAFYQFFGDLLGLPIAATGLKAAYTKSVFGFPRVQSFSLEPLYLANFLLIPLGIFATKAARRISWQSAAITVLISLIITIALSRGGYAAAVAVVVVIAAMLRSVRRIATLCSLVLAGVILGIGLIYVGAAATQRQSVNAIKNFSKQATNVDNGVSVSERAATRDLALKAFQQHPVFGVGIGNFGPWAHRLDPSHNKETAIVNNEPLELLAETGIVGGLGILLFVGVLLWQSIAALKRINPADPTWTGIVGLSAAVVGFGVQYLTLSTLYITYIWVTLGLLLGLQAQALRSKAKATDEERRRAAPRRTAKR